MKILIVIPNCVDERCKESRIPIGMAYVNGALRVQGFDVKCLNLNYIEKNEKAQLRDIIKKEKIGVILCGGTSFNYKSIKEIFLIAKSVDKNIITIGGGAGFTSEPIIFSKMTNADCAVLGEAEKTICDLLKAIINREDIKWVNGIVFKKNDSYQLTPNRNLITDLNAIPFPSYEEFGIEDYFKSLKGYKSAIHFDYSYSNEPRVLPMLLGRSCPFKCKFCFHSIGDKYRSRSFDNFFSELDYLIATYQINGILLLDELFGVNENRILEFCSRIKKYNLRWFSEIRVDMASEKILSVMKDAGCTDIQFGLESMSARVLEDMNKKITRSQIEDALEHAYKLKMNISGYFIFGAEAEDTKTFLETFDWWNHHRYYGPKIAKLALYPGSEYYRNSINNGIIPDKKKFIEDQLPYVNISKMSDFEWERMNRVIKISQIDEDNDNRYEYIVQQELLYQWLRNKNNGIKIDDWFFKRGYMRIGIWGINSLSKLLYEELKTSNTEIVFFTDLNIDNISEMSPLLRNIRRIKKEEIVMENINAIIVTNTNHFPLNVGDLRKCGYEGAIDSLLNAVLQIEYNVSSV